MANGSFFNQQGKRWVFDDSFLPHVVPTLWLVTSVASSVLLIPSNLGTETVLKDMDLLLSGIIIYVWKPYSSLCFQGSHK